MPPVSTSVERVASAASERSGQALRAVAERSVGPAHTVLHFTLENGLTLLVAQDRRAPVFCYQTWFRVGSKDENPKRTGLAHLFEHLMFKGTTKYPTGTFDQEMERRGAQTNAATWVDWTYYTQALVQRGDNLQTVVDFESDRMVNLVVDKKSFESELEVVKNERRLSVDDAVGGAMSEALMALAFTRHSYRWSTIGSMAHLEAATLDDLRQFYRRHYAPNNATVVVVGDVDPQEVATLVAKAYGPLQPQPVPRLPVVQEPAVRVPRRRTLSRSVLSPQLVLGWHAPAQGSRAFYALEMLVDVLSSGDTGRLYRRLVTKDRLATDVSGFVTPFAEPGLVEFHVTCASGVDPVAVEEAVLDELEQLQRGLSAQEVAKARNGLTLSVYDGLRSVEGLAEALGHYQTTAGDFTGVFAAPAAYASLRPEELLVAAKGTFSAESRSVVVAQAGDDDGDYDDETDPHDHAGSSAARHRRPSGTRGTQAADVSTPVPQESAPWR